MSILLDALKKSEQQRQLGRTPTLQTSVESQPPSQYSLNHWIPLSMLTLSVCVMTWFGWQQFRVPETANSTVEPPLMTQSTGEQQPRTLTESFQPDSVERTEVTTSGATTAETGENDKVRLNQSFTNFTAESDKGAADASADNQTERASPPPKLANTPASAPAVRTRQRQAARPRKNQAQAEAQARQSRVEPHVSEPISYWELPQAVRDELTEIKITVLVYAQNSRDRFLLVNGERLVEKDTMPNGLQLEQIRRDGAVFVYRKYRFLVKG